jgi:hypothetical protein
MSVPVAPVRCCRLAVAIERDLGEATIPSPTRGGRYSRHRLTVNTGTAVAKFHDERDILQQREATTSRDRMSKRLQSGT